jgi:3'(2'), 5'-bisphosphate nucleotidase
MQSNPIPIRKKHRKATYVTESRTQWLHTAIVASLAAGKAILEVYDSPDMGVEKKADDSPLTRADRRSHAIITAAVGGFSIPVLSEEGRDIPFEERRQWARMWIVDPLDGTKEFIKRNGEFTVNIALVEKGVPTLGVVYVPVTDTLYFADHGLGAFMMSGCLAAGVVSGNADPKAGLDDLIAASTRLPAPRDPPRPFTVMGSRSHGTPELAAYVAAMRKKHGDVDFISAGSSLKICKVAEGKADIYPRLGPTMEWDTAAGQSIAVGSGARVVRHDSGEPLAYNKADLLNPWFIVERP